MPLRTYTNLYWRENKKSLDAALDSLRDSYIGWFEAGFWSEDDFQGLSPKKDRWLATTGYGESKQVLQWLNQAGKRNGIGIFAYVKAFNTDGRAGWAWAERNPDLLLYHAETGKPLGRYDLEKLTNLESYEKKYFVDNKRVKIPWNYAYTDTTRPSIVDIHARATIESVKMFGWAGARFDGDFQVLPPQKNFSGPSRNLKGKIVATEKDAYYTWAASVKRYVRRMKKAFPGFEVGYNGGMGTGDPEEVALVVPAQAAGGGMIMNEPLRSHNNYDSPYNPWRAFADAVAHDSRKVRSWGGFYQIIGPYGMRADDYLYQSVYTLAAQAKPYGPYWFNTPFSVRLSRFVTRYAGILCGDLYPVPSPDSRFEVKGSGKLDWKNYVNFLDVSDQRRDYVISLINPPVPNRANSDDARCLLRPSVKNVKISIDTDAYEQPVRAWQLDPWTEDGKKAAKLTQRPGGAEIELPFPVSIWSVVVIECELKED